MNEIREQILAFRWGRDKSAYINYFTDQPERLEGLLECIYSLEKYPIKEYASYILTHILKSKKISGLPFYNDLADVLFKTDDQTVLRNVLNCLNEIGIQEYRESELFDLLLGFIADASNKVALQVYSIRWLIQICEKYPELVPEVREVIHINSEGKTAAYKVGMRDFGKKFKD
ncbi:MAG: hypothetical protein NXI10_11480 [bacterium]|nr:hypothetical protein [bacterium]